MTTITARALLSQATWTTPSTLPPSSTASTQPSSLPPTQSSSQPSTRTPSSPAAPSPVDQYVARLENQMATFDIHAARRQTAGIIAAGMSVAGAAGQVCKALLPPGVGLGVAAVLSAGVAAVSCAMVSNAMHGLRDKSSIMAIGVLTFFSGFAEAGSVTGNPLVIAAATTGVGLGFGALFARQAETRHFDIPQRIERAREVTDKFRIYETQHRELEKHLEATKQTGP